MYVISFMSSKKKRKQWCPFSGAKEAPKNGKKVDTYVLILSRARGPFLEYRPGDLDSTNLGAFGQYKKEKGKKKKADKDRV